MWDSESPNTQVENVEDFGRLSVFFLRRGQSVEVWLMTRTGQAGPCVNVRLKAAARHGSDHAAGTMTALIRNAGKSRGGSARRGEPMAADPTQRVGDNAFHLPAFLIQNLSREIQGLKTCI